MRTLIEPVSNPLAPTGMAGSSILPWWLPFGSVPEVDPVELSRELSSGAAPQLLDVRTRSEWAEGNIRRSVNVPITDLQRQLDSLGLDGARPVVVVCLSGHRSIPAVRLLATRGFPSVRQLRGGMLAWRRTGLPETRTRD
jgi:rhodanese-related sulfurtransferase